MIPKKPYTPWQIDNNMFPKSGEIEDKLRYLTNYAILAPSSHNTQPWLFRVDDNSIEIFPDLRRTLDYSDRTYRELYTSLGCALGNLLVAAEYFGLMNTVEYLPEDTVDNVAVRVQFSNRNRGPNILADLFSSIQKRSTNRHPYIKQPINKHIFNEVLRYFDDDDIGVHFVTSNNRIARIAKIVQEAHLFAFGDKYFKEELSEWVRSIYSDKRDGMPLFDFGIPGFLSIFAKYMVRYTPARIQSAQYERLVSAAPALLVITSKFDTREYWLRAGKILEYIFLVMTKNKVALAPLAGMIEHLDSRDKLAKLLHIQDSPVFFARLGYPSAKVHHSPRIPSPKSTT